MERIKSKSVDTSNYQLISPIFAKLSAAQRMDQIESLQKATIDNPIDIERFLIDILINDPDPIVRHEAAFVLGKLAENEKIKGIEAALTICQSAIYDQSVVVRHECVEALYAFQGEQVNKTIQLLLDDPQEEIRFTAIITAERRLLSNDLPPN